MQVFKAMRSSSQPVAVKILHEHQECPDFGQEIALLKACRHSNIVAFQASIPFSTLLARGAGSKERSEGVLAAFV